MAESRQERVERLRREAHLLTDLTKQPGWELLVGQTQRVADRDYRALTEPNEVSVRRFDFDRGKLAGMKLVLDIAEKAMRTFEEAERNAKKIGGVS